MKPVLAWILFTSTVISACAQTWNDPPRDEIERKVRVLIIPNLEFEAASGLEILEFIRIKLWETESFEGEAVRMSYEFRISPESLSKSISIRETGLTCRDALDLVCGRLGIAWRIEKGRIVFTDSDPIAQTHPPLRRPGMVPGDRESLLGAGGRAARDGESPKTVP